jgi:hypothetical protein
MPYQIKNGIIYGSGAVSLTQAQYDALSTAEKNNGTVYYIYDSDAVMDAEDVGIDGGGTVQDLAESVATIETSPATAAHAVGDYILWNGQLYEVTSAIAVGETLTVGTNITATTLTNGLTSVESAITLHNYSQAINQSINSGGTRDITTTVVVPADFGNNYIFSQQYAGNPSMFISNYFRNSDGYLCVTIKNAAQSSQTCGTITFKYLILNDYE